MAQLARPAHQSEEKNGFILFSDAELEAGMAYIRKKHGFSINVSVDALRKLANMVGEKKKPGQKNLSELIRKVARDDMYLKERNSAECKRFNAYVNATAKMFSDRRARGNSAAAKRRRNFKDIASLKPAPKPAVTHEPPTNKKGQYILI